LTTQNSLSLNNLIQGFWHKVVRREKWVGWDNTHLRFYNVWGVRRLLSGCNLNPVAYAGAYWFPYGLVFRRRLARLLQIDDRGKPEFPIIERPFDGTGWLHRFAALSEYLGFFRFWPFSITSWSIGVLALKEEPHAFLIT